MSNNQGDKTFITIAVSPANYIFSLALLLSIKFSFATILIKGAMIEKVASKILGYDLLAWKVFPSSTTPE